MATTDDRRTTTTTTTTTTITPRHNVTTRNKATQQSNGFLYFGTTRNSPFNCLPTIVKWTVLVFGKALQNNEVRWQFVVRRLNERSIEQSNERTEERPAKRLHFVASIAGNVVWTTEHCLCLPFRLPFGFVCCDLVSC